MLSTQHLSRPIDAITPLPIENKVIQPEKFNILCIRPEYGHGWLYVGNTDEDNTWLVLREFIEPESINYIEKWEVKVIQLTQQEIDNLAEHEGW